MQHLGVGGGDYGLWEQEAGTTVFSPYDNGSDQIPPGKEWKVTLRVEGLDAMKASLAASGIEVITNSEWDAPGVGRFAQLHDPEGNLIELWEPD